MSKSPSHDAEVDLLSLARKTIPQSVLMEVPLQVLFFMMAHQCAASWTLTPDGLKTDEQLWLDDFLMNDFVCSHGCGLPLTKASQWDVCIICPSIGDAAVISCPGVCGGAWCRKHADKED